MSIFPAPTRCRGDADFDLDVDFGDISSVLMKWNTIGPLGDADDNGRVDFADISTVLVEWGRSCP